MSEVRGKSRGIMEAQEEESFKIEAVTKNIKKGLRKESPEGR